MGEEEGSLDEQSVYKVMRDSPAVCGRAVLWDGSIRFGNSSFVYAAVNIMFI